MIRASDKKLIIEFEELVDVIKGSTSIDPFESAGDRRKRIELLKGNYEAFCNYYFPEYCFAPFAWFHKKYPQYIANHPNAIYLLQWSREFAKSTHAGLFLPLYLKFRGELTGMMVGSNNENMAAEKLKDVQANLEGNQRIKNDFGEQMSWGNWADGSFKTKDDTPFYGFGKGQSPRGTKFKWKRPNYGLIDDLNDKRQLKNDVIAQEDFDWVIEELKPALWIKKWWLVVAQNKFHDNTVTAMLEDAEDIKCEAFRVDMEDAEGHSNWPENFSDADCATLRASEGGGYIRERLNTPFEEGKIFRVEWMPWVKPLALDKYDTILVQYLDPSYTATDKSDYKAWVLLGKTGKHYDVLKAWLRKTTSKEMWEYAFTVDELVGETNMVQHAMEASFIQEQIHKRDLEDVEDAKGRPLRVMMDFRAKPGKFERVYALQSLFVNGYIRFNEKEKGDEGMKTLRKQLLAFEKGSKINDDGPDALEGAIWIIDRYGAKGGRKPRSGKFNKKGHRSI